MYTLYSLVYIINNYIIIISRLQIQLKIMLKEVSEIPMSTPTVQVQIRTAQVKIRTAQVQIQTAQFQIRTVESLTVLGLVVLGTVMRLPEVSCYLLGLEHLAFQGVNS